MTENDAKYDLIYAYALGCLDGNDLLSFREKVINDEAFTWDELGEFQNLAALMTSILVVEIPKPEVKEKVAQKLYNLKIESTPQVEIDENTDSHDEHPIENIENIEEEVFPTVDLNEYQETENIKIEEEIEEKPIEESLIESEKKDGELPLEDNKILADFNPGEETPNEDFFKEDENRNEELTPEDMIEEETKLEDNNESELFNEEINTSSEPTTEQEDLMEENKLPFDLGDDFLPKRKEPEKFRFEEVDDSPKEKVTENFIEKFIEHNKSSITEKIDQTIEGLKEQVGSESIINESGYELVQPLSKKLALLNSRDSLEKNSELEENSLDDHLVTDSLKSQELQRVFIQKGSGSKFPIIILSILSILFLGAAFYFYINFNEIIKTDKQEITQLKNDSATLYSSKQTSHAVISFLESPNVTVVELGPTDAAPNSSGKLYINFGVGSGYLYTKNLPVLESDNSLQLWLSSGEKFISLGVINTKGDDEYYPFNFKPIEATRNTEVLVTEEKNAGAKQPSSKLLLIGALE